MLYNRCCTERRGKDVRRAHRKLIGKFLLVFVFYCFAAKVVHEA